LLAALAGPAVLAGAAQGAAVDQARLTVARGQQALSCPDEDELAAMVRRARSGDARSTAGLRIDVEIRPFPGGFEASIRASGARQGERVLRVDGPCEGLAQALAVSLALLLDDDGQWSPPAASSSPVASASSAASAPPVVSAIGQPSSPPASPASRRPDLVLGAGLARGLPGDAVAPLLLVGVQRTGPGWGLLARGAYSWSDYSLLQGGVSVQTALLQGRACWMPADSTLQAGLCGRLGVGVLRGTGSGHSEDRSVLRPWAGAGPAAVIGGGGPRGAILLEAGLWVPLRRETFSVDNVGGIQAPAVGLDANLSVALPIW
jgi:hypothetical protein